MGKMVPGQTNFIGSVKPCGYLPGVLMLFGFFRDED